MSMRNMRSGRWWVIHAMLAFLAAVAVGAASVRHSLASAQPVAARAQTTGMSQAAMRGPIVTYAEKHDVSPPLRDIPDAPSPPKAGEVENQFRKWYNSFRGVQ